MTSATPYHYPLPTKGSSPCLRPGLSLSTVRHYAPQPVVFISQTIRHPLNQLDLVIEPLGHPVTVTMSNVMGNRLKPTIQRPRHPLERLLRALARSLNQLPQRLAS